MNRFAVATTVLALAAGLAMAQTPATSALMAQLHEAIGFAEHGQASQALALTHRLLEQHPDFEPALKFQGALLEDMGRGPEAADSYRKALALAPDDAELLFKVGVVELVAGNKDDAIRLFERRLKLVPHDADTLYYLAQAYHLKGDNESALKTIRECLKADPNNVPVWQKYGELLCSSGDNENALKWLLKAQHADPTLDRIDFDLAIASYKNEDLTSAAQYSTKAAQLRPGDRKVLALLASVDVKLGQWQDAEPIFKSILTAKPEDISSLLGLGHCELELKNYQAAADTLEKLLRQDPTQILAHFYLSRAYVGLGRKADAQHEAELHSRMLEQMSAIAPDADTEKQKAMWQPPRQLLETGHEQEAIKYFSDKFQSPYNTPAGARVLVAALYVEMGKTADANRVLQQAMTIDPQVRGAHTYLGVIALQQGDLDKAEAEFKDELASNPNEPTAAAELGEIYYRQSRWADAAEKIVSSRTTAASFLYMLCDAYFQLGKIKDADLTAELLVDYSKKDPEVLHGTIELLNRNHQEALAQRLSANLQ